MRTHLRLPHFILESINLLWSQPEIRSGATGVQQRCAAAEGAVNKLKRLVTVHGDQERVLEFRLVLELVQAWPAGVAHTPVCRVLLEDRPDARVDAVKYAEIDVVRVAELFDQTFPIRHL